MDNYVEISCFCKRDLSRATIRPYFPGHVLFFAPEISVRADFVNCMKSPEFWTNP